MVGGSRGKGAYEHQGSPIRCPRHAEKPTRDWWDESQSTWARWRQATYSSSSDAERQETPTSEYFESVRRSLAEFKFPGSQE
ncbi:unnamed protein product [Penicillium bialowiezense]